MNSNKKVPVLYLDNSYTFGGAINSLLYLIRALDKDTYYPILVTGQNKDFLSEYFNTITYYHVKLKLSWVNNTFYKALTSVSFFQNKFLTKIIKVMRILFWFIFITLPEAFKYYLIGRKHRVKLVHLNNILGSQLAGIIAAKMLRVPCIAHLRDFEQISLSTKLYAKLIDHHIAISSAIRDNLLELGVPMKKISIIYDAVDLDEFHDDIDVEYLRKEFCINEDDVLFGVFGRIIDWKGIKEFILTVAEVVEAIPNSIAFIVGNASDGEEEYFDDVKKLTSSLGLEERVIFTGYREDIPALMKLLDVIVHSSITPEPFGMVIIEGMAMGKPIVATRGGGPIDIVIEGETGFLVEMGNIKDMAGKIIHILRNRNLAFEIGRKGKERVASTFCKERYGIEVEILYTNILKNYK